MKKIYLTALATSMLSSVALAADLPARAPALAPAPVFVGISWAGFYVGGQVGYVWGETRGAAFNAAGAALGRGTIRPEGFVGGLHAGYNWQSGSLVYGLEADGELSFVEKNQIPTGGPKIDENYRASARVRLGYAFNQALLYVTGGVAARDRAFSFDNGAGLLFKKTDTRFGWTLGAGVEYAFTPNWSARVEYRYTDFGTQTIAHPAAFAPVARTRLTDNDHSVRVGLSYHFASPVGAIVAKY